jgi:tetratricopeptide (TPR) repeat protein
VSNDLRSLERKALKITQLRNKALRAHQERRLDVAIQAYQELLNHEPDDPIGLKWFGTLYAQMGDYTMATTLLKRALEKLPNDEELLENTFILAVSRWDWELSTRTLVHASNHPGAMERLLRVGAELVRRSENGTRNLIDSFLSLSHFDSVGRHGVNFIESLLRPALNPGLERNELLSQPIELLCVFANLLRDLGKSKQALELLNKSARMSDFSNLPALRLMTNLARDTNDLKTAQNLVKQAIEKAPDDPGLRLTEANIKNDLEDWGGAEAILRPLVRHPGTSENLKAEINLSLSNSLIFQGKFNEGYALYGDRLKRSFKLSGLPRPELQKRLLRVLPKTSSRQKHCVVVGDQGLGDQILYSSLILRLKKYFESVSLYVDPRLKDILLKNHAGIEVLGHDRLGSVGESETFYWYALSSLPELFLESPQDLLENEQGYISPSTGCLRTATEGLSVLTQSLGCKKIVGLSIFSQNPIIGTSKSLDFNLLYKTIAEEHEVLVLPLQPDDSYISSELLPQAVINWMRENQSRLHDDLDFVSGVIANCSAIIGSANSISHLACASQPERVTVGIRYGNRFPYWKQFGNAKWYPGSMIVRQIKDEIDPKFYQRLSTSALRRGY